MKDGYRILKLVTRESPGQRNIADPRVQQTIRDTLRNRKEQLLRSAYLAIARDDARVRNYLAEQVVGAASKLPDAARRSLCRHRHSCLCAFTHLQAFGVI